MGVNAVITPFTHSSQVSHSSVQDLTGPDTGVSRGPNLVSQGIQPLLGPSDLGYILGPGTPGQGHLMDTIGVHGLVPSHKATGSLRPV